MKMEWTCKRQLIPGKQYGTRIDPKAVARHLVLLKFLGFDLLHMGKDGYCLNK